VLELGREGAKRQRGTGRRPALLNTLGAWQREKEGEGVDSVPRGGRRGAKRVGPGRSDSQDAAVLTALKAVQDVEKKITPTKTKYKDLFPSSRRLYPWCTCN
jgi:hypothetical protein